MRGIFPQIWTRKQRGVLSVSLLILCLVLFAGLLRDSQTIPDRLPDRGPRAGELMSQLDLNSADAASLSAIPRLGQAKASAIVAYRDHFLAAHPDQRAFEEFDDLYHIKGIGLSTMDLLRQFTFIASKPATQSSR